MSDAVAVASQKTVARGPKKAKELDSRDFKVPQREPVRMAPLGEEQASLGENIVMVDRIDQSYADALAFAEEPVKILIHRSTEKYGTNVTDLVAVNGVHAEILFAKNGWVQIGYLPRGVSFITKRKYVERLAQAKRDQVNTNVIERDNADPENYLEVSTTAVLSFTILEDKSPKAEEWLTKLITMQA